MRQHQSSPGQHLPAIRRRRPGRRGIGRAVLAYLAIVYVLWVCYYAVQDLAAGKLGFGVLMGSLYTAVHALILFGVLTLAGAVTALLLRPHVHVGWLALLSIITTFAPSLYWWSRPTADHKAILIQQIAQALFLGYLLFALRRFQSKDRHSRPRAAGMKE